jgi:hypothetical protein
MSEKRAHSAAVLHPTVEEDRMTSEGAGRASAVAG